MDGHLTFILMLKLPSEYSAQAPGEGDCYLVPGLTAWEIIPVIPLFATNTDDLVRDLHQEWSLPVTPPEWIHFGPVAEVPLLSAPPTPDFWKPSSAQVIHTSLLAWERKVDSKETQRRRDIIKKKRDPEHSRISSALGA